MLKGFVFCFCLALFPLQSAQPSKGDNLRGGWMKSRTKGTAPAKPSPAKPRGAPPTPAVETLRSESLGLGYTVFMVNASGQTVRVANNQAFKSNDRIRLLVETNSDGYIYIFSQENNEPPRLLFPNTRVRNGGNFVEGHKTFWLPEAGEIEFDERPAKELLTVVFSQQPLPDVFASDRAEGTPVESGVFQKVALETSVRRAGHLNEASLLTQTEAQRGVRLNSKDPAPATILLNQSPSENRIVAKIEISHH
jgi:hypothetical protein